MTQTEYETPLRADANFKRIAEVSCIWANSNVKRHSLERLASFVDAIVGKRLTYARLIAKVPA